MKLMPYIIFDAYKGMKRAGNSKYGNKYKIFMLPLGNFFFS